MLRKLNFNVSFEFDYIVLSRRLRIKTFAKTKTLDARERNLAIEMSTSRTAHVGRERDTPAKQHQAKAWATKAQQDLPVNVVINSRLLACKVEIRYALNYVKPTLRVSPTFKF
jgi:hypothetical protein